MKISIKAILTNQNNNLIIKQLNKYKLQYISIRYQNLIFLLFSQILYIIFKISFLESQVEEKSINSHIIHKPQTKGKLLYNKTLNQLTSYSSYIDNYQSLVDQGKAFIGTIYINPGYYWAYVETEHNGVFQIPDTSFINRALDKDKVVILQLSTSIEEEQHCTWGIGQPSNGKLRVQSTFAAVINIIQRYNPSQIYKLDCLIHKYNNKFSSTILFQPINPKFPLIECMNTNNQLDTTSIYTLQFDIKNWSKNLLNPPGEIISVKKMDKDVNLDKMAEFALQMQGIQYSYKKQLTPNDSLYKDLKDLENNFCKEVNLNRKNVFVEQEELINCGQLKNIDDIINTVKQANTLNNQQIEKNNKQNENDNQYKQQLQRKDLTDLTVFTIDPATAKDFDDACSLSFNIKGKIYTAQQFVEQNMSLDDVDSYVIGVHIADVTAFTSKLDQQSPIMTNAQSTTSSVYFADRCCPMFPYELADGLCSLNPAVPRYCFSCIFQLNKKGNLIPQTVEFCKSVVISRARLDYITAQKILDNINYQSTDVTIDNWPIAAGYHQSVELSVKIFNDLAKKLRQQRSKSGALEISNQEVYLGCKNQLITINQPEIAPDSHYLIEEFMVITNCLVAMRIINSFPCCALLRQHQPPIQDYPYNNLIKKLVNTSINVQSPLQLIKSLELIGNKLQQKYDYLSPIESLNVANQTFLCSSLARAKYIAGMSDDDIQLSHWGIHSQCYIHFTSPIRRYVDDLAHQMLQEGLLWELEDKQDRTELEIKYQPHKLVINQEISLYDNSCSFYPDTKIRQIASQLYPVEDDIAQQTQHGGKNTHGIIGPHQNNNNLFDALDGKISKFNPRENMKLKQKFQSIIEATAMDANQQQPIQYNKQPTQQIKIDYNSPEYKLIEKISLRLEKINMPINQIKTLTARANQLAILITQADSYYNKMAWVLYMQQNNIQQFNTKMFLIKIDKRIIFYLPKESISFDMENKLFTEGEMIVTLQVETSEPLNKQINQGVTKFCPKFLEPIDVVVKIPESILDGIDIFLPQGANQTDKKQETKKE